MSSVLGTISSAVKMPISRNFTEIWKQHFTLISTSVYSFILVVLEKIMESEFKCPEKLSWRHAYVSLYFIVPAVTIFVLGIIFQPACQSANKCKCHDFCSEKCNFTTCCHIILKAVFPAVLWAVILLLDGRYIACACKNITEEKLNQSNSPYQISQISGLSIILVGVVIGSVYWCCIFCKKDDKQKITVDNNQINNLLEKKACEYISEQKEKALWQSFKKCLNDNYLADPETISESISNTKIIEIIDKFCKIPKEGSADKGMENASTSAQGTSGLPPEEESGF